MHRYPLSLPSIFRMKKWKKKMGEKRKKRRKKKRVDMSSLYIHRLDSPLPVAATFSYRTKNVSIKSIEQLGSDRRVKSWNIHQACMHALIIYADWKGCIMTLMSMVGWCWLLSLAWSHALALGSRRCRDQTLVGGSTKRLKKRRKISVRVVSL